MSGFDEPAQTFPPCLYAPEQIPRSAWHLPSLSCSLGRLARLLAAVRDWTIDFCSPDPMLGELEHSCASALPEEHRTAHFLSKFQQQLSIPACAWGIQVFQSGFQSLNIHMTFIQRVIILILLMGAGTYFFPLLFLVESEQRAHLENFPAKFQLWKEKVCVIACLLVCVVSAFILLSSRLKCVSTSTVALKSLYISLVTLGSLEFLVPASPDQKALVECCYSNFASPSTKNKNEEVL